MKDVFVIKKPLITEKATGLNQSGKYVFIVKPTATKPEVKQAIQARYGVQVRTVHIVNLPGKEKRFRNSRSQKGALKKAIVTLKEGQTIDLGR